MFKATSKPACIIPCLPYLVLGAAVWRVQAAVAVEDNERLGQLVTALRRLDDRQPPLRGMVRCFQIKDGGDAEVVKNMRFRGRFFRRGNDLRLDYLRDDFQGASSAVSRDDISEVLIAQNGEVTVEAHHIAATVINISLFGAHNPGSRSASSRLRFDLRFPLNAHVAPGDGLITEILQLATAKVDYQWAGGERVRISASKPDPNGNVHHFTIDLDPKRGYCATDVSDEFGEGETGY
ncbi:MAG: hypothetical protein B7Z73_06055, partial [Planctomycetia bacterium 21-64-5]